MARYGLSIEKNVLFRGIQQPFANVYFYQALVGATEDDASLTALLDQIVAKEKEFHTTKINFKRARLWITGTGSRETNIMRVQKTLTGTGARAPQATMDAERALLIQWPAGFDSRHRPVKLRKWYHLCGHPTTTVWSDAILANESGITDAQRTAINTLMEPLFMPVVPGVGGFRLVAQSGRQATASGQCHPYLEHHQLGDQWRG